MERLKYPFNHEWHVAINRFHSGKVGTSDWKRWMYEAKAMADEVPRLALIFGMERRGELRSEHQQCSRTNSVPIEDNHLTCCLGKKCSECPELIALDKIEKCTPEEIDLAKAWTCAAHIAFNGGDVANEGYVTDKSDRMFWDNVCQNLACDGEN